MREEVLELSCVTNNATSYSPYGQQMMVYRSPTRTYGTTATSGTLQIGSTSAAWVIEAARKLENLGRLQSGWDSYHGLPLAPKARELTLNVLDWLGLDELPVPAVVLGSGGFVHLEWRAKGRELEVELRGDDIDFVKVYPSGEMEEGIRSAIGESLRGLSQWLLHG